MFRLNLPDCEIKTREKGGRLQILDILRRRFVALTPEEWVRQHFVHYLIEYKGYPRALLANEVELSLGKKRLRCDTVLYSHDLRPRMVIEYKSPSVAITRRVFDQISVYNLLLRVDYLVVSNGVRHACCRMDYAGQTYAFLTDFPAYNAL